MYIVANRFAPLPFVMIVENSSRILASDVMPLAFSFGSSTFSIHSNGDALNSSPWISAPGLMRFTLPMVLYSTDFLSTRPSSTRRFAARTVVLPCIRLLYAACTPVPAA
ncbi:hypothetical protein FEQ05_05803 [Burkholderia pseudomultivorans]|nr:hypothetical protein [Burkholderia pseudomultivorans]